MGAVAWKEEVIRDDKQLQSTLAWQEFGGKAKKKQVAKIKQEKHQAPSVPKRADKTPSQLLIDLDVTDNIAVKDIPKNKLGLLKASVVQVVTSDGNGGRRRWKDVLNWSDDTGPSIMAEPSLLDD